MITHTKLCFALVAFLLLAIQSQYADADGGTSEKKTDGKSDNKPSRQPTGARGDQPSANGSYKPKPSKDDSDSHEQIEINMPENEYLPPISGLPYPGFPHLGSFTGNDPACFPLIDHEHSIFAEMCGALPQIRYSLPNLFGHKYKWEVFQVLNTILGSSTLTANNPSCNRSLRTLICPLLFPPCPTPHEPKPILPCAPFCRAVKSECVAPSLDLLPCHFFPENSDLCPAKPNPYSALLAAYVQQMMMGANAGVPQMQQPLWPQNIQQSNMQLSVAPFAPQSQGPSQPVQPPVAQPQPQPQPQPQLPTQHAPLLSFVPQTYPQPQSIPYALPLVPLPTPTAPIAPLQRFAYHPLVQPRFFMPTAHQQRMYSPYSYQQPQTPVDVKKPILINTPPLLSTQDLLQISQLFRQKRSSPENK